ncbi:unnamed protein product [Moneuplotes crassus]|uniref:Uncharacterized protein n=1 Tax=Euplotes crassus TaxID=5936 RepID=A0AAD1XNR6_EUPCR|nr:unnamed protein product [Moneuplotes crassus]
MSEDQSVNQSVEEIDEELRKKIALYYHPLFQASLAQWIIQMQTKNYTTLSMEQYRDLNIRIQKSLILDFDYDAAASSAFEDWKIDIEREKFDQEFESKKKEDDSNSPSPDKVKDYSKETLDYERLSEFFFDLCLSWCQHLDIETFLYFLNGVFLNITTGAHISISNFKKLENINVLSIGFFDTLIKYRTDLENTQEQDYKDWYDWNFKRTHEIVKRVEANLANIFDPQDKRAFDIWMDIPENIGNSYIDSHIEKLDKQLKNMSKINQKADTMAKTITNIDTIKRMSAKAEKPGISYPREFDLYPRRDDSEIPESQIGRQYKESTTSVYQQEEVPQKFKKQKKFEKSVIATLPQEYKNAKLIEITETSYLIRNEVKLPIFGRQIQLNERDRGKKDISQLMQSLFWKKGTRPVSHSTIKEEEEKLFSKQKGNIDLKAENVEQDSIKPDQMEPKEEKKDQEEEECDESYEQIEVDVPQPGDPEYEKIQDQNQAIKRLIINVDSLIKNFNAQGNQQAKDELEEIIRQEIDKEMLLSPNEKKTIEVLVLDYLQNNKSVLDLISLAKLEEDFKLQQEFDGDEDSARRSEDKQMQELNWRLPDTQQYMELIAQRVPNKYETVTEIKYKIPMKWTKKFNVDDIVPHKEKLSSAIQKEGGMVNNYMKMKRKKLMKKKKSGKISESVHPALSKVQTEFMQEISTPQEHLRQTDKDDIGQVEEEKKLPNEQEIKANETDGFDHLQGESMFQSKDQKNVPLSNTMLKESLSSRKESPMNETTEAINFPKPDKSEESKTLLQKHKQLAPIQREKEKNKQNMENYTEHDIINDNIKDDDDYTPQVESPRSEVPFDARSRDLTNAEVGLDYSQIKAQYKPEPYNIDEIEHLFIEGKIPKEIYNIEDPMEYNYLLVKLKKEFNDKTRSEFLKYMNLQLPYNSRRDEVGGVITDDDWTDFVVRMQKMIKRVRRKRRRIIRRRKKKGKKLMPRKTLFKPKKKPNLAKDPLWREVFLDEDSEDSTVEDTDIFERSEEGFKVRQEKPKPKFFERKEKFKLPDLYKPLVNESKKIHKEKEYTFKSHLKDQIPKNPTSPLKGSLKNKKLLDESPARKYFNLHFVKHGNKVIKNAPKKI